MKAKFINEYVNRGEDAWADEQISDWKRNKAPDFWDIAVGGIIEYFDIDNKTMLTGEIVDKGSTRDEDYVVVEKDGEFWNVFLSQIEKYSE